MEATSTMSTDGRLGVWPAIGLAAALLIGGGAAYGLLEMRYARAFQSAPIPPGSLDRLPLTLGEWQGRDEALHQALIMATDTDAHVSRRYQRHGSPHGVSLWVGYGGRFRDLVPHRPEVCYPSNGYTLEGQESIELTVAGEARLPCRVLHFARGSLQSERIAVLNYFLVDGEYCPDVSLLRSKAMRWQPGARYVAQVQIVCHYDPLDSRPDAPAREFARDSAAVIRSVIEEGVRGGAAAADTEVRP